MKAAAVCPACLQKGDPPGKVAVYGGILPPEQGLQPPADLSPAALTCGNGGAASHGSLFRSRLRPSLSGALFLQVKAAPVCPADLQKGDPPGKMAVYGGILPPEQGLQPPADLYPAALTCGNEGAASGCRPDGWIRCREQKQGRLPIFDARG